MTAPWLAELAEAEAGNAGLWRVGFEGRLYRGRFRVANFEMASDARLIALLGNHAAELIAAAETVERVKGLADVVRKLQQPDADTGDRDVSFFALLEALDGAP